MQSLDIISVNIWSFLIALANLTILFLLFKKFLFKPVKKVIALRREEIEKSYTEAEKSNRDAETNKLRWEQELNNAKQTAEQIIKSAANTAELRGERIVAEAKEKADGIVRRAETEAELELKKAEDRIKQEIVDVSALLAEKMLEREIKADDHKAMIDSFIDGIGEEK